MARLPSNPLFILVYEALAEYAGAFLIPKFKEAKMNVKIGYRIYDIQFKGSLYSSAPEKLYGQIDYDKKLIEISNEFDLEQQACTLLHEIIHGVSDDRAISLDEDQVNQLAIGLYQAMLDNQKLFKEVIII